MNKTLAIAARELTGRRSLFITAALLAIVPYAVLLVPEVKRYGSESVVAITGAFVACCYIFGLALTLGATFVNRELWDKRLSFYFSRPVSPGAIWFGKLLGALTTIGACAAIIVIPTFAGAGEEVPRLLRAAGYFVLIAIALFFISHTLATMLRSRSAIVVFDLIALTICGLIAYAITATLVHGWAVKLAEWTLWSLAIGTLLILIGAGAWQLTRGRTDLRANHAALSRFVWTGAAVMFVIAGAAVWWIVSVTPDDLDLRVAAEQLRSSDWVMMIGDTKSRGDYKAAFLKNAATGEYHRLPANQMWWGGFVSGDGKLFGQLTVGGDVHLRRVSDRGVEPIATNLQVPLRSTLVANDDGSRLAILHQDGITVCSIPDGRILASVRMPSPGARAFFVTPDLLRVYVMAPDRLQIRELHVPSKQVTVTGEIATDRPQTMQVDPTATRLLVRAPHNAEPEVLFADARTGAISGTLGKAADDHFAAPLSDGRTVLLNARELQKVAIYNRDLTLHREVAVPGIKQVWLLRELAGQRLLVGGNGGGSIEAENGRDWSLHIIDLNSGAIVRTERGVRPLQSSVNEGGRRTVIPKGAPFVGLDADGKLKRITL